MIPWEQYVLLEPHERALVRFSFVTGLWAGEVQAVILLSALAMCGVRWDAATGTFITGG